MKTNSFLITHTSNRSVKEVIDQIEKNLHEKNVMVFARINHGKAAKDAGLTMQDEEVIVFGNPKVGTALMLDRPAIGIELPLKVVAFRQGDKTMIAYQDLDTLADMFGIKEARETVTKLSAFMKMLVESVG